MWVHRLASEQKLPLVEGAEGDASIIALQRALDSVRGNGGDFAVGTSVSRSKRGGAVEVKLQGRGDVDRGLGSLFTQNTKIETRI